MTTRTRVLLLASLASFMTALDTLVVTTALTTIRLDLGASVEQLEWTVNAYNLSFAVLLMTAAALGDRLGRRRMFAAGIVLFALASAACALAPSAGWLIAARALQGAGAALVMTLGLALVGAAFPPERRGGALGIFFAVTGLAVASGPLATASPVTAKKMPSAPPRRSGGNAAPTSAKASVITSAAPAPWNVRATISHPASGARAQAADAAVKRAIPAVNMRRRPSRSPRAAAVMSSTANVRL